MAFPIDAIQIDFDMDIEYGQDQANVSYPTVFPPVENGRPDHRIWRRCRI